MRAHFLIALLSLLGCKAAFALQCHKKKTKKKTPWPCYTTTHWKTHCFDSIKTMEVLSCSKHCFLFPQISINSKEDMDMVNKQLK